MSFVHKCVISCCSTLFFAALVSAQPEVEVSSFVDEMIAKHDFDRSELERSVAEARVLPRIVELMDKQTKRKTWSEYRSLFINREKLDGGLRFWREHRDALALASFRHTQTVIADGLAEEGATCRGQRDKGDQIEAEQSTIGAK